MINSVDSSYLSLGTTNSLWKKLAASKVTEEQAVLNETETQEVTETSTSFNNASSVLSLEDLIGMMQTYQMPAKMQSITEEEASDSNISDIDSDGDGTISTDETI